MGSVFIGCFAFNMALESDNQKHQLEKKKKDYCRKKGKAAYFCKCFHVTFSVKTIWLLEVAMGSMSHFYGILFYFLVCLFEVIL